MNSKKELSEEQVNVLLGEEDEKSKKKRNEKELLEDLSGEESKVDEIPAGVHPLKKPIRMDNEEIHEIEYDLDQLTPIQYTNLIKRLSKKHQISVPEVDPEVQISYFALASGIPVTVLKSQLNTADYAQICGLVRTFLLGASAEELEE